VDTNDFLNATTPDMMYNALEPYTPPIGMASCSAHDATRFDSPRRQQAAFDGDPVDPATDYPAARAICMSCPLLALCRRYALDSRDENTFLAGMTAEQRSPLFTKKAEIAKRRRQVAALHRLGAPTRVIAELVDRDPSLIRGDLRAIGQ
jgi:hypothetical protein